MSDEKKWLVEWPENELMPYFVNPDGHRVTDDEMLAALNRLEVERDALRANYRVLQGQYDSLTAANESLTQRLKEAEGVINDRSQAMLCALQCGKERGCQMCSDTLEHYEQEIDSTPAAQEDKDE